MPDSARLGATKATAPAPVRLRLGNAVDYLAMLMTPFRRLLALVLCALLALGGSVQQRTRGCGTDGDGGAPQASCCKPTACCCGTAVSHCTRKSCEGEPKRTPVPAPVQKSIDLTLALAPQPRPAREQPVVITAAHTICAACTEPRTFRSVPARLLHEAHSVWRC